LRACFLSQRRRHISHGDSLQVGEYSLAHWLPLLVQRAKTVTVAIFQSNRTFGQIGQATYSVGDVEQSDPLRGTGQTKTTVWTFVRLHNSGTGQVFEDCSQKWPGNALGPGHFLHPADLTLLEPGKMDEGSNCVLTWTGKHHSSAVVRLSI